jgi:hypothetical protein
MASRGAPISQLGDERPPASRALAWIVRVQGDRVPSGVPPACRGEVEEGDGSDALLADHLRWVEVAVNSCWSSCRRRRRPGLARSRPACRARPRLAGRRGGPWPGVWPAPRSARRVPTPSPVGRGGPRSRPGGWRRLAAKPGRRRPPRPHPGAPRRTRRRGGGPAGPARQPGRRSQRSARGGAGAIQAVEDAHGLRGGERQVEPGDPSVTGPCRHQRPVVRRRAAGEDGPQGGGLDLAGQAEVGRPRPEPLPWGLAGAGVVLLAAGGHHPQVVALGTRTELADRQHPGQAAGVGSPPATMARSAATGTTTRRPSRTEGTSPLATSS